VIVVLLNVYLVILFLLVKFGIVRFNLFWKVSMLTGGVTTANNGCSHRDRQNKLAHLARPRNRMPDCC